MRSATKGATKGADALAAAALAVAAHAAVLTASAPAAAYEFWTRARSTGEAYELRGFRLIGHELSIPRRRFTQSLSLVLHDLGDFERERRRRGLPAGRGLVISWRSTLRFEHDFGTFVTGRLEVSPTRRQDALDLIPEIEDSTLALSLLYGHLSIDGLWDDRLSLRVGRIADVDATGALPLDGLAVRADLAEHVRLSATAGLAVRDSSPLGVSSYELDGTSGAACREYVEALGGQPGRWELIDRSRAIEDGRYTSDFEYCPQRDVVMPTASLEVATRALPHDVHAAVGYRIARSPTVGLIGERDRLPTPDLGLYPSSAPEWGTNLEQLYALAEGRLRRGGATFSPRAFARASLVDFVVDRAEAEVAIERGGHRLTPSISRFVPTFDADSIWSVFGAQASLDLSLDYRGALPGGPSGPSGQVGVTAWGRRYDGAAWAYGVSADAQRPLARRLSISLRALGDAGTGGERAALHSELRFAARHAQWVGRAAAAWVRGDETSSAATVARVSTTAATAATFRLAGGVAAHAMLELRRDSEQQTSLRAFLLLDVALESDR